MKPVFLTLGAMAFAAAAQAADVQTETVCGADSIHLAAEVQSNPEGYFVVATSEQINHGDARIVRSAGRDFTICTRNAATPDMSVSEFILAADQARVSRIFVPDEKNPKDPTG